MYGPPQIPFQHRCGQGTSGSDPLQQQHRFIIVGVAPLMLLQHLLRHPVLLRHRDKPHQTMEVLHLAERQAIQYRQLGMVDQKIDDASGDATPLEVGQDVGAAQFTAPRIDRHDTPLTRNATQPDSVAMTISSPARDGTKPMSA